MEQIIAAIAAIAQALSRIATAMESQKGIVLSAEVSEPEVQPKDKKKSKPKPEPEVEETADEELEVEIADADEVEETADEEPEVEITLEDLRNKARAAIKKGKTAEVEKILAKFKVASLSKLATSQYEAVNAILSKLA